MRSGKIFVLAVVSAMWMLSASTAANATPPLRLDSEHVTDASDVLSAGDETAANARLADTYANTNIDLYIVFVDEFTSPNDRIDWANETADLNGLGDSQYLLAVSTDGRQYFISGYTDGPLSDSDLGSIEEDIVPSLRDSDWLGAIITAADSIEEREAAPARNTSIAVGVGVGALGLGGAAWGVTRAVKRKKVKDAAEADLTELDHTAGSALVAADNAVKSSAQELEFARAQFGDDAVKAFEEALETTRTQMLQAFSLRQQLDDTVPDTHEQKVTWFQQIIELCDSVDETLDAQEAEFTALRNIEQNAPAALDALENRAQQIEAARTSSEAELERLTITYSAGSLAALAGASEQIASLLKFAAEREAAARATLDGAGTGAGSVAIPIREAESAIAQIEALTQAITTQGKELADLDARCTELIAELERDVQTARSTNDPTGSIALAAQATEQHIQQARAELTGTNRDPQQAFEALNAANTHIDQVLHAAQESARARQVLDANFARTADQVRQAEAYIESRRGGIGATARTRISEARAALSRAEATRQADPTSAQNEMRRASSLASQALASAQSDVSGYGSGYGGGYNSGYGSGSNNDSIIGAILGGILGSDGSSGGSSWGGSSRSRSSGSWGGSSRSRSRSSSSRSSSRRSSGGGSRRSRGGGRF